MQYKIAVIPGDGIGPEVIGQATRVLEEIGKKYGHTFEFTEVLAGGCAINQAGQCLPEETVEICKASDAVLLGAVGGPKWDHLPGAERFSPDYDGPVPEIGHSKECAFQHWCVGPEQSS